MVYIYICNGRHTITITAHTLVGDARDDCQWGYGLTRAITAGIFAHEPHGNRAELDQTRVFITVYPNGATKLTFTQTVCLVLQQLTSNEKTIGGYGLYVCIVLLRS